ncbi:phenazine biosynthesis-like domain-containing protein [Saccoglossus kowalevskii]|uniref:Phenazine biosynthesis-like domain-containing protein-like n=1 Tax=Saccoglossus kowalevskii TaxID=10224 RepID=A0ABM0GR19_SACKO|nr:PREDICTED: phenazine biosynthesis-like domain-containing protein-like [Saccoglossus kowalevskii]
MRSTILTTCRHVIVFARCKIIYIIMATLEASETGSLDVFIVDAFTAKRFAGNPAAVCLLEKDIPDIERQKIASEMNLSETAYIQKISSNGDSFKESSWFNLRWFTPTNEVVLCGHATLASAAVLFHCKGNVNTTLHFKTLSGTLLARKEDQGIVLDLPLYATVVQDEKEVLSVVKATVGSLLVSEIHYNPDMKKLLVRLDNTVTRNDLESMKRPDSNSLLNIEDGSHVRGVMVTLRGTKQGGCVDDEGEVYDFISRYFAPWAGISEDPVTGSAHAVLAGYWSNVLEKKQLYARQCSPRGGDLRIVVRDDNRVDICGQAVIVMKAQLTL